MFKIVFESSELGTLEIINNPTNISDVDTYFLRSEEYHGVNQRIEDFSFNWVLESADYIRNIITAYGAKSVVNVTITETNNRIDYQSFYFGKLDLITYKDLIESVECRVVTSDVESKFLNNLETEYKVYLPSEMIIKRRDEIFTAQYNLLEDVDITAFYELFQDYSGADIRFYAQTIQSARQSGAVDRFNNIILTNPITIPTEGALLLPTLDGALLLNPYTIYKNPTENSEIYIEVVDLVLNVTQANYISTPPVGSYMNIKLIAALINANNEVSAEYVIKNSANIPDGTTSQTITLTGTYTIPATLASNERIVIYLKSTQNAINPAYASHSIFYKYLAQGTLSITATEYKTNTSHRAISVPRAFNRLIYSALYNESLTTDPTISYLDSKIFEASTRYGRTYLTSGNDLRQYRGTNGIMITSFADLFKSLSVPFCLGMGITKQGDNISVKVDHRSEFYKPELVYDLGEVSDLSIEFDMKRVFNAININYPSVDNKDFTNGIYEYLTKYGYTTPASYVDNTLENSCSFKVDATSIEELRTNQTLDTQENQQDDNTNFIIRCVVDGGVVYSSNGSEFGSISQTGLQNNTQLFNVDMFAPVTFRFWAWWILAALEYYENTDKIVIQRSEQNNSVAITIDGVTCDTNDVTIAKLKQLALLQNYDYAKGALFEPYNYIFKAPVTTDFINTFEANRHGVLKFTYKNKEYYGYALKIPAMPRETGEFTLLKLNKRAESYV